MTSVEKFKCLLDDRYDWPATYTFKFIVPSHQEYFLEQIVKEYKINKRPSRTGKFVSYTVTKTCQSSDEVIETYQKVSVIDGVVSM